MRTHVRLIGVTAAVAVIGLAGCGADSSDTNSPTATVGTSGAQVEIGNTINYGSFGTTADIDCADGKSLNVGGTNNTLTVTGTCANANIGGADNKITIEQVDNDLSVIGLNNTVTYKRRRPEGQRHRIGQQDQQGLSSPVRMRVARRCRRGARHPRRSAVRRRRDSAATRDRLPNSKSIASASGSPH